MPLPRFHIFKPRFPAGVNWGHPLADGLVFLCVFDGPVPIDLVSGEVGVASGAPNFVESLDGSAANLVGVSSQYFEWASRPELLTTDRITTLWRGAAVDWTVNAHLMGKRQAASANSNTGDMIIDATGGGRFYLYRASTTGFRGHYFALPAGFAANKTASVSFIHNSNLIETAPVAVADGNVLSVTVNGTGTGAVGSSSAPFRVGRRNDGATYQFNGLVSMGAWWKHALTVTDVVCVQDRPWVLLRKSAWNNIAASTQIDSFPPALYARKRQHLNLVRR